MHNLNIIGDLAANQVAQDNLGMDFGGSANEAMQKALAKQRERDQEQLGAALIVLLDSVRNTKQNLVSKIRAYRAAIEEKKASLAEIDRCIAYGNETGNYVPLAEATGVNTLSNVSISERNKLRDIPKDWKPKQD